MRNPRGAKFTAEQEAALSATEALMTRARIMERGVSSVLMQGEYASAGEIEVCAAVLTESVALRIDCETKRAAIRKAEMEVHPRHKVKINPNPARRRR
jgi:hypothetical protein